MQVLPCVIAFVGGVGIDRIIGFEGLGSGDSFSTRDLEARLLKCGVLVRAKLTEDDAPRVRVAHGKKAGGEDEDEEDDDWD